MPKENLQSQQRSDIYLKKTRQFNNEFENATFESADGLPFAMGTGPENPLDKNMLLDYLVNNLQKGGVKTQDIEDIKKIVSFAEEKTINAGKQFRKSGDETITHPLWMANLASQSTTTDVDVIKAIILHDVHEDTSTSLEEIEEISNFETRQLVDIVSKVRAKTLLGGEVNPKAIKKQSEKETLEKILTAIEKDPRALIIKAVDVIHNQMTSMHTPDNVRLAKANLALEFYEPLVRRFGFTHLADMIGDYSFSSVKRDTYEAIKSAKEEFGEKLIPVLQRTVDDWMNHGVHDKTSLNADAITIESPSVYKIYQTQKNIDNSESQDIIPVISIACANESELIRWHRYFDKNNISKLSTFDIDTKLNQNEPVEETIFITDGDKDIQVTVSLATQNMLITPAHLLFDSVSLSEEERKIAESKLKSIRKSYTLALEEKGGTTEQMVEAAQRSTISVIDLGRKEYEIPSGSTALDLAYRIGKNLGNDAVFATIWRKAGEEWRKISTADLGTVMENGVRVEFTTDEKQAVYPRRYDLVTTKKAVKDIREEITKQILEMAREKFGTEDSEQVEAIKQQFETGEYLPNIREVLEVDFDENTSYPELIQEARNRGVEIIEKMYLETKGKKLDSHIVDVFENLSEDEIKELGNCEDFLINLGLTPMPLRNSGFMDRWIHEEQDVTPLISYARKIVGKLTNYRANQTVMNVTVPDKSGILKNTGEILKNLGLDVQIRSTPDNKKRGRKSTIEIRFVKGSPENIKEAQKIIQEYYGNNVKIVLILPDTE